MLNRLSSAFQQHARLSHVPDGSGSAYQWLDLSEFLVVEGCLLFQLKEEA